MNSPVFTSTAAIAAQIRAIRAYADSHDRQRLFIRCELWAALEAIERPETSAVATLRKVAS